jgi:hypothetical protein
MNDTMTMVQARQTAKEHALRAASARPATCCICSLGRQGWEQCTHYMLIHRPIAAGRQRSKKYKKEQSMSCRACMLGCSPRPKEKGPNTTLCSPANILFYTTAEEIEENKCPTCNCNSPASARASTTIL